MTTPFAALQKVTASRMNQLMVGQLDITAAGAAQTAAGTTASTTYTGTLTTTGALPAVTLTSRGNRAWIFYKATMSSNDGTLRGMYTSVAISGATTLAAGDGWATAASATNAGIGTWGTGYLLAAINVGTNTFTLNCRMNAALGGTGVFQNLTLHVWAP